MSCTNNNTENITERTEINNQLVYKKDNTTYVINSELTFTGKTFVFSNCCFEIGKEGVLIITCENVLFLQCNFLINGKVYIYSTDTILFSVVNFNNTFNRIDFQQSKNIRYDGVSNNDNFSISQCRIYNYCLEKTDNTCILKQNRCQDKNNLNSITVPALNSEYINCNSFPNKPFWLSECP